MFPKEFNDPNLRRVILSSLIGATIEWYDFFLYGVVAGIVFNKLYVLANMPIQRFGATLIKMGEFDAYLGLLQDAHLDANLDGVMCRNLISMDWRGYIYDCDFNQMLDLKVSDKATHLNDFDFEALSNRNIVLNQHCYGCTAGAGSSCGGELV